LGRGLSACDLLTRTQLGILTMPRQRNAAVQGEMGYTFAFERDRRWECHGRNVLLWTNELGMRFRRKLGPQLVLDTTQKTKTLLASSHIADSTPA
jgi:hypothetical protein